MKTDNYRIISFDDKFKVQRKVYSFWNDVINALLSFFYGKENFKEFSTWETFSWIHNTIEDARAYIKALKSIDESLNILNWKVVE